MKHQVSAKALRWVAFGAFGALTGCGFFPGTTSSTSTTSSTGDYVYVVNQTTDTLSAYSVGAGALTLISGSPYVLTSGLAPASVAVTRPNTFVYVGGDGGITSYSIGTGGVLTLVAATAVTATANFVSLTTSPDGQWLLGLDSLTQTAYVYAINTSTGALSLASTASYAATGAGTVAPRKVRISPNGAYVIATLGGGGDALFTFNTTTGVLTGTGNLAVTAAFSDNAAVFDANSAYVYIARAGTTSGTSQVASYSVGSLATLNAVSSIVTGNTPYGMLLDSTGTYLYTANRGDSTVSGFTVASGTMTALSGSPYASGSEATALVEDNSDKYVLAAALGGSSDLTLYSLDALTAGKLDAIAVAVSGTDPAGSISLAATH